MRYTGKLKDDYSLMFSLGGSCDTAANNIITPSTLKAYQSHEDGCQG